VAFLGRCGYVVLVCAVTKQWVADLRLNGTVTAIDFSRDGKSLYAIGGLFVYLFACLLSCLLFVCGCLLNLCISIFRGW
jgi:hypothetical protein